MFIDMFITLYDDLSKISRSARYQMAKTNEFFSHINMKAMPW